MAERFHAKVVKTTSGGEIHSTPLEERILIVVSGEYPRFVAGYFPISNGQRFRRGSTVEISILDNSLRGTGSPYKVEPLQ